MKGSVSFTPDRIFPGALLLFLIVLLFPVPGQDDFYITLRPAEALAETGEILNYNDERIEQSSSLLLVLVLTPIALVFDEPAVPARFLTVFFALLVLIDLRRALGLSRSAGFIARLLLTLSAPFLYWAASGMEMTLAAWLLLRWNEALAKFHSESDASPRSLLGWTTLVVLCRPEGVFVLSAVLVALFVIAAERRRIVVAAGATWLIFLLLGTFRTFYFGSFWPQPVHAKIGVSEGIFARSQIGLRYLFDWNGLGVLWVPLLFLAALQAVKAIRAANLPQARDADRRLRIAAMIASAQLGFVVTGGGDWMEGGRFCVAALPFLAALLGDAYAQADSSFKRRVATAITAAVLLFTVFETATHRKTRALPLRQADQLDESPWDQFLWMERSNKAQIRDLQVLLFLDDLVERAAPQVDGRLLFTSHQMGFISYRLQRENPGKLQFVDAAGLVERTLSDCDAIRDLLTSNQGGLWRKGFDYSPHVKARFLLEHVSACTDRPIDILYELGVPDPELLAQYGLRTVYVQDGEFLRRPSFTYVAVREELADALDLRLETVVYGSKDGRTTIEKQP